MEHFAIRYSINAATSLPSFTEFFFGFGIVSSRFSAVRSAPLDFMEQKWFAQFRLGSTFSLILVTEEAFQYEKKNNVETREPKRRGGNGDKEKRPADEKKRNTKKQWHSPRSTKERTEVKGPADYAALFQRLLRQWGNTQLLKKTKRKRRQKRLFFSTRWHLEPEAANLSISIVFFFRKSNTPQRTDSNFNPFQRFISKALPYYFGFWLGFFAIPMKMTRKTFTMAVSFIHLLNQAIRMWDVTLQNAKDSYWIKPKPISIKRK